MKAATAALAAFNPLSNSNLAVYYVRPVSHARPSGFGSEKPANIRLRVKDQLSPAWPTSARILTSISSQSASLMFSQTKLEEATRAPTSATSVGMRHTPTKMDLPAHCFPSAHSLEKISKHVNRWARRFYSHLVAPAQRIKRSRTRTMRRVSRLSCGKYLAPKTKPLAPPGHSVMRLLMASTLILNP